VFVGPVGSETRREYTVMGDAVNLAARLMQLAGRGHIRADHATYQATRANIAWDILESQRVKGKAAPVQVYQPLSLQSARATIAQSEQLIGRARELAQCDQVLERLTHGQGGVICIEGEAGMGTSRLVRELIARQRERGLVNLHGSGDAIEQQTSYNGWREIFSAYFALDEVKTAHVSDTALVLHQQRELVLARFTELAPTLRERAPLLNDLLGLDLPETELTRSFDPRLRQASLAALLTDLLTLWAQDHPFAIIVEDAQWLDSLSWQLALQVARTVTDAPLLLVLALRPLAQPPADHPYSQIGALPHCQCLRLSPLNAEDVVKLFALRLGVN
jgi:predicted ATPase